MTAYPQGFGIRPASLPLLISHAYEVTRSNPAHYPMLAKFPDLKDAARALWNAHRRKADPRTIHQLATEFNGLLTAARAIRDNPKSDKPTVGRAKDRLGEKKRREAEKADTRKARAELTRFPFPADGLWGSP